MRRLIAAFTISIALSATIALAQPGPWTAQIQRAIAALANGTTNFTQLQCNGSTGTVNQVLVGGNPCTWTGSPAITALSITAGINFNNSDLANVRNISTVATLTMAANGNINNSQYDFRSNGAGLVKLGNGNASHGIEYNVNPASGVSSCGTGALTSNSTNSVGGATATGATACTVNFGTTNFDSAPICTITDLTTAGKGTVSASAVGSFTVSNLTSGDAFNYNCYAIF